LPTEGATRLRLIGVRRQDGLMSRRLTDEKTGQTTHRIRDDGRITDEKTGQTTHRIRDGIRLTDAGTGRTTHRIRD